MLGRAARLLYEASSLYRVPQEHTILRVAVVDADAHARRSTTDFGVQVGQLLESCIKGMASSYVCTGGAGSVSAVPSDMRWQESAVATLARRHIKMHRRSRAVPVLCWPVMSGEQIELDVVWSEDSTIPPDQALYGGVGLERCNAAVLLHSVEDRAETVDALDRALTALPRGLPVTLCGAVSADTVRQGHFGLGSVHGRWAEAHVTLARQHSSVYAVDFACPEVWGQGFHLLYKAQMSVLYSKATLLAAASPKLAAAVATIFEACDLAGDGVWCADDIAALWLRVYGREATIQEQAALFCAACDGAGATELMVAQLQGWLEGLAAVGKSDAVWAILRAFGYNGRLDRVTL